MGLVPPLQVTSCKSVERIRKVLFNTWAHQKSSWGQMVLVEALPSNGQLVQSSQLDEFLLRKLMQWWSFQFSVQFLHRIWSSVVGRFFRECSKTVRLLSNWHWYWLVGCHSIVCAKWIWARCSRLPSYVCLPANLPAWLSAPCPFAYPPACLLCRSAWVIMSAGLLVCLLASRKSRLSRDQHVISACRYRYRRCLFLCQSACSCN